MAGYAEQISSPIVEGLPYYRPDWIGYELDLAKAEEHLRAAWNGLLWDNGFEITLVYALGDPMGKAACEILQNNLFAINPLFKIKTQLMTWPAIVDEIGLGNLPIYVSGWTAHYADPHNFVFPYMHSEGFFAKAQRYDNQLADHLIEAAISSSNHTERQMLYDQIAELYYNEVPSVMLAQVLGAYFFRDWIQGFVLQPNENNICSVCVLPRKDSGNPRTAHRESVNNLILLGAASGQRSKHATGGAALSFASCSYRIVLDWSATQCLTQEIRPDTMPSRISHQSRLA